MKVKDFKGFLLEWGYGGEGGVASKDPIKMKSRMFTEIDMEDQEEEEEDKDIPILSDTNESANNIDVDPWGEEDWDDVGIQSYYDWEGSISDYLRLLNIPAIDEILDKISRLTVRKFYELDHKIFDDLEDLLAQYRFCPYEEFITIRGDFEDLDQLCIDFKPDEEYEPSDFEKFFNENQFDPEFERRFNYFLQDLYNKNGAGGAYATNYDLHILSYIHNHFYDMDLRNEYMERIINKESPKKVCIDIYKRVKKKSDILNNLIEVVKRLPDKLNEANVDVDPWGEEDWSETDYSYKNWRSKGGEVYDFLLQLKNPFINKCLERIKRSSYKEADSYIEDIMLVIDDELGFDTSESYALEQDMDQLKKEYCYDWEDYQDEGPDPDEQMELRRERD